MPGYPEPLERIDSEIDEQGSISTHDAYQYRKVLGVYAREARRNNDPILAQEVARLQAKVDAATMAPPTRAMTATRIRADPIQAAIVWDQITPEERAMLLMQIGYPEEQARLFSAGPLDAVPADWIDREEMYSVIVMYPRSAKRREYLRGNQQVRAYRRWR